MRTLLFVFLLATAALAQDRIADLGSPDWRLRDAATEALLEMGDKAFPLLLAAMQDADPERAARADWILLEIHGRNQVAEEPTANPERVVRLQARAVAQAQAIVVQLRGDLTIVPASLEDPGPAADPIARTEAGGLIERLGSDSWTEREEATDRLMQSARDHRDLIEEAARSADLEVASRAAAILASWQERSATATVTIEGATLELPRVIRIVPAGRSEP